MKKLILFILIVLPFITYAQVDEAFGGRFIMPASDTIVGSQKILITNAVFKHPRGLPTDTPYWNADSIQLGDVIVDCQCNWFTVDSIYSVSGNTIILRVMPDDTTVNRINSCTGGIIRMNSPPNGTFTFPAGVSQEILDCFLNYNFQSIIAGATVDTSGYNRSFFVLNDTAYIVDDLDTLFISLLPYIADNSIYNLLPQQDVFIDASAGPYSLFIRYMDSLIMDSSSDFVLEGQNGTNGIASNTSNLNVYSSDSIKLQANEVVLDGLYGFANTPPSSVMDTASFMMWIGNGAGTEVSWIGLDSIRDGNGIISALPLGNVQIEALPATNYSIYGLMGLYRDAATNINFNLFGYNLGEEIDTSVVLSHSTYTSTDGVGLAPKISLATVGISGATLDDNTGGSDGGAIYVSLDTDWNGRADTLQKLIPIRGTDSFAGRGAAATDFTNANFSTIVVMGAPFYDVSPYTNSGEAYIFLANNLAGGDTLVFSDTLICTSPSTNDHFGHSAAAIHESLTGIDSSFLIAVSATRNTNATPSVHLYLFNYYTQEAEFLAEIMDPVNSTDDWFGSTMSLSIRSGVYTLIVSDPGEDAAGANFGALYMYDILPDESFRIRYRGKIDGTVGNYFGNPGSSNQFKDYTVYVDIFTGETDYDTTDYSQTQFAILEITSSDITPDFWYPTSFNVDSTYNFTKRTLTSIISDTYAEIDDNGSITDVYFDQKDGTFRTIGYTINPILYNSRSIVITYDDVNAQMASFPVSYIGTDALGASPLLAASTYYSLHYAIDTVSDLATTLASTSLNTITYDIKETYFGVGKTTHWNVMERIVYPNLETSNNVTQVIGYTNDKRIVVSDISSLNLPYLVDSLSYYGDSLRLYQNGNATYPLAVEITAGSSNSIYNNLPLGNVSINASTNNLSISNLGDLTLTNSSSEGITLNQDSLSLIGDRSIYFSADTIRFNFTGSPTERIISNSWKQIVNGVFAVEVDGDLQYGGDNITIVAMDDMIMQGDTLDLTGFNAILGIPTGGADGNGIFDASNNADTTAISLAYLGSNLTLQPRTYDIQIGTNAANNTGEFEFYALTSQSQDVTIFAGSRDSSSVVSGEGFAMDVLMSSFGSEDGIMGVNYKYLSEVYNLAFFGDSVLFAPYPGSELMYRLQDLPWKPTANKVVVYDSNDELGWVSSDSLSGGAADGNGIYSGDGSLTTNTDVTGGAYGFAMSNLDTLSLDYNVGMLLATGSGSTNSRFYMDTLGFILDAGGEVFMRAFSDETAAVDDSLVIYKQTWFGSDVFLSYALVENDAEDKVLVLNSTNKKIQYKSIDKMQNSFQQDSIGAGVSTLTLDVAEADGKVFFVDCTSVNTTVTLTISNPHENGQDDVTSVITIHFLNITGGSDTFVWPAAFYDMQGTAMGTDIYTAGTQVTCYWHPLDNKWYCSVL